jgi:ribosomal protein L11
MKGKIIRNCVFQIPAGEAKPGQKIASFGIPNMSKFCLEVNKLTVDNKHKKGEIVRVKINIDEKKN